MNKKVLIVAGAAVGAILLAGAVVFAGLNVAQAATQAEQAFARRPVQRHLVATNQVTTTEKGLVVVLVQPNSAADKAGVKRGDILLKIDNQDTNTLADYRSALSSHKAGDQVKLTLTHGDTEKTLTATLTDTNGRPDLGLIPFGGGFGRGGHEMGFAFPGGRYAVPISGTQTVVMDVSAGGPADKAGIKRGDVIVSVDGKKLDATNVLSDVIATYKPNDIVTLQVISNGQSQRDVKVTLGDNPSKKGSAYLGITYREDWRMAKLPQGGMMPFAQNGVAGATIISVTADSPAAKAGLKQGDTITALDGQTVNSPQALSMAVGTHKPGDTVTLSVKHADNSTTDVKVTLGENPNKAGTGFLGVTTGQTLRRQKQNGQQGIPGFQNRGGRFGDDNGSGSSNGEVRPQQKAPLGDSL